MKFLIISQTKLGSSLLLPAHGKGGERVTMNNNGPSPYENFLGKAKEQAGKKKRGSGGN